MFLFVSGFLFGFISLAVLIKLYISYIEGDSASAEAKMSVKEVASRLELLGSIKYRYAKVKEITERQMELISHTDRPSASASHSQYKNNIIRELKALEDEKVDIFRSILKDGVDPKIQIMVDGVATNVKMSEAIDMHDANNKPAFPPPSSKKTDPIKPRKNGLRIINSDEEDNDSSNSEVP